MIMVYGPFSARNDGNDQQGSETDTVLSVWLPVSVQRERNDETRVWLRRAVDRLPSKIVSRRRGRLAGCVVGLEPTVLDSVLITEWCLLAMSS